MLQHLEQEVKLDVGPDWSLPDLSGLIAGAQEVRLPPLNLEATYYDTIDQRLAQRNLTLRYRLEVEERAPEMSTRRGGRSAGTPPAHVWTVKLPSDLAGAALSRTEVNWTVPDAPAGALGRGTPAPLPEAAEFVAAVTLGEPLRPVARVVTIRLRTQLRTSDGRMLAEIAHDAVTGTNLMAPPGASDANPPVTFTEVEIELADGSALEVLDAVAAKLLAAGARHTSRKSKLMTVLQPPQPSASAGDSAAPRSGRRPRARTTMADVLQEQALACLDVILEHDPPIRLGDPDPEHVHRSRVATRRFRSVLRAFRPLVYDVAVAGAGAEETAEVAAAEAWFAALRDQLSWLGQILGNTRDADVRLSSLQRACAKLGEADADGAAAILVVASAEQQSAHRDLLQVMTTQQYMATLRALEALGRPGTAPPLAASYGPAHLNGARHTSTPISAASAANGDRALAGGSTASGGRSLGAAKTVGAAKALGAGRVAGDVISGDSPAEALRRLRERLPQPAAAGMSELGRQHWLALAKAVRRLGPSPSDEALHKVRILAKRLRYIAEVTGPLLPQAEDRRAAASTVKAATRLQDILGELHDGSVNEIWLRETVSRLPNTNSRTRLRAALDAAVTAGQLIAAARNDERSDRQAWPAAWRRLHNKKVLRWTASG